MTTTGPRPTRIRVTSSRRGAGRPTSQSIARDLDEQTGLGDVYLAGLMRAQFRLSALVVGLAFLGIGGFPVLLLAVPATRSLTILGLPFPWVVLGILVYPAAWVIARWYVRQAEKIESDFADVVGQQ
ncbi:MAG TPA: hypothetical protein PK868_01585 [Phycicoccus sp.]|nr:hypothetical protein [Phycicoccus sp.]HQH06739.1 hypothetical protein [Phycicoccus sp.]HQK31227.1 hypothetical protein [Phycicoccus sp.]